MAKIFIHGTFNAYKQEEINIPTVITTYNAKTIINTNTSTRPQSILTNSNKSFEPTISGNKLIISNRIHDSFRAALATWVAKQIYYRNLLWGQYTPYCKVIIIRGIGYRAFHIKNDFTSDKSDNLATQDTRPLSFIDSSFNIWESDDETIRRWDVQESELVKYWSNVTSDEFPYSRYLVLRAGHTHDKYIPLPPSISIKISKRERKLVIYGVSRMQISNIARQVYEYRKPSVYTGRGIRRKHVKVIRKAGKKDKQKGRSF